jgi:precorrin-6Y C5,15-methyltransferase (decarboxylating)
MNKKISIVGTGMNGFETMTTAALNAVKNADVIIGAKRMVSLSDRLDKPVFISYDSHEIADYISNCNYEKIAVLMSGDCGFYSGAEKLIHLMKGYDTEIICGISSPVYFCSKLQIPWQNVRFVNLHGAENSIVRHVCANENTFFLMGGKIKPMDICERLCEYRMNDVDVYIGENLGYENERILRGKATDFIGTETENLCVMLVHNQEYERHIKSCIPDDEFIRGNVPMTKSIVRSVCVSKLEIAHNSVCWDIGSGTGSVSVEMAMKCADGRVYAVERNHDAVILTDKNRHKFGCDNIEIINSDAENTDLPVPDCVFIGGSGGKLEKIISAAYGKNPDANIIITAVSLETLNAGMEIFEKYGVKSEVTQIAVTGTRKIGHHTMLNAENPIFIIRGIR